MLWQQKSKYHYENEEHITITEKKKGKKGWYTYSLKKKKKNIIRCQNLISANIITNSFGVLQLNKKCD